MRLNETTKIAQQEIASHPARPETSHSERDRVGPNSIPIDRKGPLIGQTFSYTDSPSNDFSYSKGTDSYDDCKLVYDINYSNIQRIYSEINFC